MLTMTIGVVIFCIIFTSVTMIMSFKNSHKHVKQGKVTTTLAERINILADRDTERKVEIRELKDQHRHDIEMMINRHNAHVESMIAQHTVEIQEIKNNMQSMYNELSTEIKQLQNLVGVSKTIIQNAEPVISIFRKKSN